jgi:amino acid transporter
MQLSDTGESRLNGYLFVLQRTLGTSLPAAVVRDAVREIESHLRERVSTATPVPDERTSLEQILMELGPPLRVAQAYAAERTLDEAVTTGRLLPIVRAVVHLATTTVGGFFAAILITVGYVAAAGGAIIAVAKIVFPENTGFWYRHGYSGELGTWPSNLSINPWPAPGEHPVGGYWVVLIGVLMAVFFFVVTHRGARKFLAWFQQRRRRGIFEQSE